MEGRRKLILKTYYVPGPVWSCLGPQDSETHSYFHHFIGGEGELRHNGSSAEPGVRLFDFEASDPDPGLFPCMSLRGSTNPLTLKASCRHIYVK